MLEGGREMAKVATGSSLFKKAKDPTKVNRLYINRLY